MDRPWSRHLNNGMLTSFELRATTVLDHLDRAAAEWPRRPALTLKGKTLTYAELKDQVDRLATGLASLGVTKGSRVALWMPNLPQMAIGYYATLRLGAQAVCTNPLYVEREILHQFNDAGVSVVITVDFLFAKRLRRILADTPVQHVVVTSIPDYLPAPLKWLAPFALRKSGQIARVRRGPGVHFFSELIANHKPTPPPVQIDLEDVAMLQYTGGTTGVPRGAMLTHRNISINAQQCCWCYPKWEGGAETVLACLPWFHAFGLTTSLNYPICIGAHIVAIPNPRDIQEILTSIQRYGVTVLSAVPAHFQSIGNWPCVDRLDLSSIGACFSGSAALPVEILERFENLTKSRIMEGFGLTEASPLTHINPLYGVRKPGSIGIPVAGTDAKIVDLETGTRELGPNQEGELCVSGPQVMAGYWGAPEATAAILRDGWLYTGDIARMDEDGYFFIVGRKKEMILASGYNVYPDEIDRVLYGHPAVLEAATIGIPDEKRGETVKSFVVRRPGTHATVEELRAYCRTQLAAYKVPRQIEFIAELPKSHMSKILRREIRARELARGDKPTESTVEVAEIGSD